MSIPKEPRMLMITLMYLVLMALLALNVSAEIINAFFALDDGNKESMGIINTQLDTTEEGLKKLLNEDSKKEFKPILPAIEQIRALSAEYSTYVTAMREELIDAAGNANGKIDDEDFMEDHGKQKPKGKKNKDVTTRILVNEGKGKELKEKTTEIRDKMVAIYSELMNKYGNQPFGLKDDEIKARIKNIEENLTMKIDEDIYKDTDKVNWEDFKFRQMPLAAVLPIMSKMQSDATTAEATLVNELATLSGGREIVFDQFFPVVNAKSSYIIAGEPFEAEISVGTYSSQIDPSNVRISVNGSTLPVNSEGKAVYTTRTGSTGKQTLKLSAEVTNPLNGKVSKGDAVYEYEVGRRSVAVSADKMNVFYLGVPNPISVAAAGVSSNDLKVSATGGLKLNKTSGNGKYEVEADKPGEATITVSGGGLTPTSFDFRVKRIPDPVPMLSKNRGGEIGSGEFKAQGGLIAQLEGFDFDAKCTIQGFNLVYVPKREDPIPAVNGGAKYTDQSQRLVQRAKPGDIYYFENIKAKCPGDPAGRPLGSIAFKIK